MPDKHQHLESRNFIMDNQKRTNGFTTYDAELHAILDCVSPNAERLYRKLFQRVNHKRGDREVFPEYATMREDCNFDNKQISRAIKELEHFQLISVKRGYNEEKKRRATNVYFLTLPNQLPAGSELSDLVTQWNQLKKQKSAAEKARKAEKLVTQSVRPSDTETLDLVTQTPYNKDEINYDEVNKEEEKISIFEEESVEKNQSILVQEDFSSQKERSSLLEEDGISVQETSFAHDLKSPLGAHVYGNDDAKYPREVKILQVYNDARGDSFERFMEVAANFQLADVEYLKSILAMNGIQAAI